MVTHLNAAGALAAASPKRCARDWSVRRNSKDCLGQTPNLQRFQRQNSEVTTRKSSNMFSTKVTIDDNCIQILMLIPSRPLKQISPWLVLAPPQTYTQLLSAAPASRTQRLNTNLSICLSLSESICVSNLIQSHLWVNHGDGDESSKSYLSHLY